MPFVLDTSVTMAWFYPDEASDATRGVAARLEEDLALVPAAWVVEVGNAVLTGERRGRVSAADAARFLTSLAARSIDLDAPSTARTWHATLALARQHRLTAYDAAYLELAVRHAAPIATLDDDLKTAAQRVGLTSLI